MSIPQTKKGDVHISALLMDKIIIILVRVFDKRCIANLRNIHSRSVVTVKQAEKTVKISGIHRQAIEDTVDVI